MPTPTPLSIPNQLKISRHDNIYLSGLTAAIQNKDVQLAQRIWIERGKYRKTASFQKLSSSKQDFMDFKMARQILCCFVECGYLQDAFRLVLSSKKRFVWSYYHLKSLLMLCERSGQLVYKERLFEVINESKRKQRRIMK
ncbi:unnamed protein product [Ambrosiozyma monospora]|uniref:Unnamed protein product n=1 Tax=Ambrosiozyma monospora TaxID=43982 RepID=A0ACB5UCN8_AMBMO|nr:unnamed protein product [Ambrosiozyma monospora]